MKADGQSGLAADAARDSAQADADSSASGMAAALGRLEALLPASVLEFRPRHQSDQIDWQGLTPAAAWIVSMTRPRLFVELGAYKGDSYCAFCQAIAELAVPCDALAVDSWTGDANTGAYGPEVYDQLRDYHDPLYGEFSKLLRMTFEEAVETIRPGTVDLLHIDGVHGYEEVKQHFESWLPRMSERGVVLMHDTRVRTAGFGVYRLWEEIMEDHLCFEIPYSNGLGVVILQPERAPEPMAAFGRMSDAQRRPILLALKALGDVVVGQAKWAWQAAQVKALESRIGELEWSIGDLRKQHRSELNELLQAVIGDFPGVSDRLDNIERVVKRLEAASPGG